MKLENLFRLYSPFEQFELSSFSWNVGSSFLTDTILVSIFLVLFLQCCYLFLSYRSIVFFSFSYVYVMFSSLYTFIFQMIEPYLESKTKYYFPFFFYLFFFICFSNLVGIIPYSFTITSHLNFTFSLSFIVWWGIVLLGFYAFGLQFFGLFFAPGVPFRLVPFLALIEMISFVFRAVSLALRLFANIVAGHILLDTVALFIYQLINPSMWQVKLSFLSLLPFVLCLVLTCFELVVALLQAYIFVILSVIYLKDIYASH